MRLLALLFVALTFSSLALADSPVSLKERVKWDLWVEGVEEFQASSSKVQTQDSQKQLPEELSRILTKLQL